MRLALGTSCACYFLTFYGLPFVHPQPCTSCAWCIFRLALPRRGVSFTLHFLHFAYFAPCVYSAWCILRPPCFQRASALSHPYSALVSLIWVKPALGLLRPAPVMFLNFCPQASIFVCKYATYIAILSLCRSCSGCGCSGCVVIFFLRARRSALHPPGVGDLLCWWSGAATFPIVVTSELSFSARLTGGCLKFFFCPAVGFSFFTIRYSQAFK